MAISVVILVGEPEAIRAGQGEVAVTAAQAAAMLKMSEGSFRNCMKRGEIAPCATITNADLFRESDVEALRARRMAR